MTLPQAYVVATFAAITAALTLLPYSWAHIAASALNAALTTWYGYNIQAKVRNRIAWRKETNRIIQDNDNTRT